MDWLAALFDQLILKGVILPAIMTHDFFGRDAYGVVGTVFKLDTVETRDAFLLGNQGPDPLFYLVADPRVSKSMHVGDLMHHSRAAALLTSFHDAVALLSSNDRPIGQAYVAGFLCHYLLDSSVHPLVFAMQHAICTAGVEGLDDGDSSEVHAEIERDLDEMVLFEHTGRTIRDYRPYREILLGSDHMLDVIDRLYFHACLWTYGKTLDGSVYYRAVKAFRLVQGLFWSPMQYRRKMLGALECRITKKRYSLLGAMSHRPRASRNSAFDNHQHDTWVNPFSQVASTESFWDLYEDALSRVFDAERDFARDDFDLAAAIRLTSGINFSGELTDECPADGDISQ